MSMMIDNWESIFVFGPLTVFRGKIAEGKILGVQVARWFVLFGAKAK